MTCRNLPLLVFLSLLSLTSSSGSCAGVVQTQEARSGWCGVMDQCDEDSVVLSDPQKEMEKQLSAQSVLQSGSPSLMEVKEQLTEGQQDDSDEEWDTDLETDSRLQ